MRFSLREGMDVFGRGGDQVGTIGQVMVGAGTREPRFFTVRKGGVRPKDYLVPREAVVRVGDRGAHLALAREELEGLPEYRGGSPSEAEATRCYEAVGGRPLTGGYTFDRLPVGNTPGTRGAAGVEAQAETAHPQAYFVTAEPYLVMPPDERERQGYRDWWETE